MSIATEIIRYKEHDYVCIDSEEGLIAPYTLWQAISPTNSFVLTGEERTIDERIFYYATEEEMKTPVSELLSQILD